jgi:hypothetical protein
MELAKVLFKKTHRYLAGGTLAQLGRNAKEWQCPGGNSKPSETVSVLTLIQSNSLDTEFRGDDELIKGILLNGGM